MFWQRLQASTLKKADILYFTMHFGLGDTREKKLIKHNPQFLKEGIILKPHFLLSLYNFYLYLV